MKLGLKKLLSVSVLSVLLGAQGAQAQQPAPQEVPVAVIVPLSGPWARGGQSLRQGAELAVEDINAAGGIKALKGAKLKLIVADAGDTPDKARNAAQRVVAENPGLIGGTGAWLSSFSLAVSEVTERAEIPWLTISFSDQITSRGFKYIFQTAPGGKRQAELALPTILGLAKSVGGKPASVGVLTDNTPSPQSILAPLRAGGFEKEGLKLVVDETFTPPLTDATSLVQKVRASRPDMLLALPTGIQDVKLIVDKLNEFGLGQGKLPVIASGAQAASPDLLNLLSKEKINGLMTLLVGWPSKDDADLEKRFKAKFNEAWMTQDAIYSYGDMWLLKEAVEQAGAADAKKVADVLRKIDLKDGAAKYYSGGRVRFDEAGRRIDGGIVIVQWQDGVPKAVYPSEIAAAKPIWPGK